MIAQCPKCRTKMRVKRPDNWRPSQKVKVTCRCGEVLMFAVPEETLKLWRPALNTLDEITAEFHKIEREIARMMEQP